MKYEIVISPTAQNDVDEIYEWIAMVNMESADALKWLEGLECTILSLCEYPYRCQLASFDVRFGKEMRQHWYHSHRIIFTITGNVVEILHIRHGARRVLDAEDL